MNVELHRVKTNKSFSRETECFRAEVWVDGKKAGDVENDGNGGCNFYHPRELTTILSAHCATLPDMVCDFADSETGEPAVLKMTPDLLIDTMLADIETRKLFDRDMKSRLVYTKGGKVYATKKLPDLAPHLARWAEYKAKWNAGQLLNTMPADEAFAIYKKSGV